MTIDAPLQRWAARPVHARLIRAFVLLFPIAGSVAFVHVASQLIEMPTNSFWAFVTWWIVLSAAATGVLVVLDRAARRLLPLAALLNLSLVFPDQAPSRFRTAMRTNTVETLEQRVGRARSLNDGSTPMEAAEQLLGLVAQLNVHDHVTRGHSERVRAYAQLIGQELHLKPAQLDALNWAALLHDVGKLKVPVETLNKVGRPTKAEWVILRQHPEFGEELTAPLREWLGEWSLAVGQHHERWDGSGYPRHLSGDGISLAARIVAVADVFDVITSARSYKPSFAATVARDEIASGAGTQFDPQVVRAFLNVSLGRLRLVMGPLSGLAHAPFIGRLPLTPAIGTVSISLAAVAAALTTVVATHPAPGAAGTVAVRVQARGVIDPLSSVTREDERVSVDVEQADSGAKVVSLRVVADPAVGRVRVIHGGRLLYDPPPDFNGRVTMAYVVCWSRGGCRRGMLTVRVLPVNDPPVARYDHAAGRHGGPVSIDVLANDSDPEGDTLSLVSVSDPTVGRAQIVGSHVRWLPPAGFVGIATFHYTAADGHGGRATALVAVKATVTATHSTPAPALASVPPPSTPAPPSDVQAPSGTPAAAPSATPDTPPVDTTGLPEAHTDRLSVPEGGSVTVDVLANDAAGAGGGKLSIVAVGAAAHGIARKVGDRVQFTAPSDYVGTVTFVYTVADARGARARATVSVTVLLVNVAPSFTPGPDQSVPEDAGPRTVPGWAQNIERGAVVEAGQRVSFVVSTDNPGLFSVQPQIDPTGTLTYTPLPNANGSATVTVSAQDDGGTANGGRDTSAPLTFTITVTPVNDPPQANGDGVSAVEDDPLGVTFDVLANDTDVDVGDTLGVLSFDSSAIANGTLIHNGGGSFTYVPDQGFAGSESFGYEAVDGSGAVSPATVAITVASVQHAPVAGADAYATVLNTPLTVPAPGVLANDGDQDGDPVTLQTTPISGPAHGTVALSPNGSFVYTPTGGYTGTDAFTYRIDDGTGRSTDGAVTISVTSGPAPTSTLYFQTAGVSPDIWDMTTVLPPAAPSAADLDGDGKPGLTIRNSDGKEKVSEGSRYQIWTYTAPAPVILDGPVTLDLWSSTGLFSTQKKGKLSAYLYDCTPGGATDPAWTGCTRIAANAVFDDPWNTSPTDWGHRLVTIGSVTRTIPTGNELRVRLLFSSIDLWMMMSAAYPTGLTVTLG